MKVTYSYYVPLDGVGTMLNPAYTWRVEERTETCRDIVKVGNLYYMINWSGYIMHSIEVEKINTIEVGDMKIACKYHPNERYPFTAEFYRANGEHYQNQGSVDFERILLSIKHYLSL